jgi:hypothetical protein
MEFSQLAGSRAITGDSSGPRIDPATPSMTCCEQVVWALATLKRDAPEPGKKEILFSYK